ncbi:MAG: NAD-dependent epimerase/dehydratase family protein [Candidatus Geothermarchaeales archaeon]
MKVLVTGGAGFIGSHVAEYYAKKGWDVVVLDNLSRGETLPKADRRRDVVMYNWNYLGRFENIDLVRGDVRDAGTVERLVSDVDTVIHAAAQVAVTSSVRDPRTDFDVNTLGTFNVLEAARRAGTDPSIIYCSTNKVYGGNVNRIPVREEEERYVFDDPDYRRGIPETFPIDRCEHTPYGCSKLAGDLYAQDYARVYGLRTGVFRMSCVYGTRQFGNEDQGWVAHFTISTLRGMPLTIFGDGKQVRDVLYVGDLIRAFESFLVRCNSLKGEVFNIGGGVENTASLLELLDLLERLTGKRSRVIYDEWRPGDQKVYVSDVSKAREALGWVPRIGVEKGLKELTTWISNNIP